MEYELEDLIDVPLFQSLQEKLFAISPFPTRITDKEGKTLTSAGWPDICSRFYRKNPVSEKECIDRQRYVFENIHEANPSMCFKCPHGFMKNVMPVIIDGKHVADFNTSQFFFEKPDMEFYREQARKYGFDEESFLEAVEKIPVLTREQLMKHVSFEKDLIEFVAASGLKRLREIEIRQSREELIKAKEKAEESEARLKMAVDSGKLGIWDWDIINNKLTWDDGMMALYGLKKGDFSEVYDSWSKMLHPEDRHVNEEIQAALRGDREFSPEFRIVRPDGSVRIIKAESKTFRDPDGRPLRMIGTNTDITDKKLAEEKLIISERNLAAAERIGNTGSWDYDIVSETISWSMNVFNLFDIDADNPGDLTIWNFIENIVYPDDRSRVLEMFTEAISGTRILNIDFRIFKFDGSIREIHMMAESQYDEQGIVLGLVGRVEDITERISARDELRRLNEELELRIEERTRELAIAKTEAEIANQTKSEFLANMSHEIRTPLNAVLGYADLLSLSLEDKRLRNYTESIKSSGRGLLTLINDILDLSKIEAGKLDLEFDYVNADIFFHEFERIFRMKLSEKGLDFNIEINSGTPKNLYIDEIRLRQILFNLIGNAIKFTEKGFVSLKVSAVNPKIGSVPGGKIEESADLVIIIEDTGVGISEEFQKIIFEPFTQQSGSKKYGGTGLGLAITRRLITLMNGTISLKSEPGKGTIFRITIPDVLFNREYDGKKEQISINPGSIKFSNARILITDDNESNRRYLIDALGDTGIVILEAENGIQAYKLACVNVPDLIITDIRMPGMDGFELLNKIKADDRLKHIPVIAYSASVMKVQREKIRNSKFAGLLIKPVHIEDLFRELMDHLPYNTESNQVDENLVDDPGQDVTGLQELVHILQTSFMDWWKTISERQSIGEINKFAKELISAGTRHNAKSVREYGEELSGAAESFDIKAILQLITKYPSVSEEFTKLLNNNPVWNKI